MSRRSLFDRLVSAREAVARAVASGADPWRVAELRQREQALSEAAAEAGPELQVVHYSDTAARRPEPELPLEWTDEAGRARRSDRGGGAA